LAKIVPRSVLDVEALEFLAQSSAGFMSVSERIVSRCGMFRLIILQTPKHQLNEFLGFLGHANNINKTAAPGSELFYSTSLLCGKLVQITVVHDSILAESNFM
jgi:hypothetical protein